MTVPVRRTLIILLLVVAMVFGFTVSRQLSERESATAALLPAPELSQYNTYVYDQGRELAAFTLFNEQGDEVTRDALKGRWTFAFIGYTYCPDICPATMAMLRQTSRRIPVDLPQPDFLLISADPDRDTPEHLKEYLAFFGDSFHGLTGDKTTLRALASSLNGVFIERPGPNGEVLVDHSAHITLIDPNGEMIAILQPPHDPDGMVAAYRAIYEWAKQNHPRASRG
ncbi:MAG: SCO family protein [Marinobacter sp.]|nr:SCO family protein [Marinobacter sp.]